MMDGALGTSVCPGRAAGGTPDQWLRGYLSEIGSHLSVDPATEREILGELEAHLEQAILELQASGLGAEQSVALALENFGEAREVGRMLGLLHGDSAHQAVLAASLPVALVLTFKWVLLPLVQAVGNWQGSPTPFVFGCLAVLALLVPALTLQRWRYGYAVWAFFSLVTIAQL
jgi:type III secretory pathway component EscS